MKKSLVLVADDDESIRQLYTDALTQAGLDVVTASDGTEALSVALETHPDIIMIDILMPNGNGHEAVAKLRRDDWGKNARIIYLTNLSDPSDVVQAVELGTEEYIIKANTPPDEVVKKVRMAMHE